jgi:hypothetical protein
MGAGRLPNIIGIEQGRISGCKMKVALANRRFAGLVFNLTGRYYIIKENHSCKIIPREGRYDHSGRSFRICAAKHCRLKDILETIKD